MGYIGSGKTTAEIADLVCYDFGLNFVSAKASQDALCLQHCTLASAHFLGEIYGLYFGSTQLLQRRSANNKWNFSAKTKQENLKNTASFMEEKNFSISTKSDVLNPFELDIG